MISQLRRKTIDDQWLINNIYVFFCSSPWPVALKRFFMELRLSDAQLWEWNKRKPDEISKKIREYNSIEPFYSQSQVELDESFRAIISNFIIFLILNIWLIIKNLLVTSYRRQSHTAIKYSLIQLIRNLATN